MDIITECPKICRLPRIHNNGLVAPLKKMPALAVPGIVSRSICGLKPAHSIHKPPSRCLQQPVIVIRHQHIAMYLPVGSLTNLPQGFHKHLPVIVILKYQLPMIPAGHHMIHRSCIFYPWTSWHIPKFPHQEKTVNQEMLQCKD